MTQAIPSAFADVDERLSDYRSHVEPLGALVERVPNSIEAAAILRQVATDAEADVAIVSAEAAAAAPELLAELERLGLRHAVPASVEESHDQRLGVSLAKRAIAETGSVLMAEPTLADRSTAMLTRTSVTLCRTADLVPSLVEAAAVLRDVAMQPGGGYATLISGPSRTADIEMSLTVGVQGPGKVAVLFVDELFT